MVEQGAMNGTERTAAPVRDLRKLASKVYSCKEWEEYRSITQGSLPASKDFSSNHFKRELAIYNLTLSNTQKALHKLEKRSISIGSSEGEKLKSEELLASVKERVKRSLPKEEKKTHVKFKIVDNKKVKMRKRKMNSHN